MKQGLKARTRDLIDYLLAGVGRKVSPYHPIILLYHSVTDHPNDFLNGLDNITVAAFEAHMRFLRENYQIVSLENLVRLLRAGRKTKNVVSITFDDGYRNVLTNALPILQKYGIPATVFLITDLIRGNRLFWRNKLAYIFNTNQQSLFFTHLSRGSSVSVESLKHFTQIKSGHKWIKQAIDRTFTDLDLDEETISRDANLYITTEDIAQLDFAPLTFGNHTRTHPILSELSAAEQEEEIRGGYLVLRKILGKDNRIPFSYPFGSDHDYGEATKEICGETGHICALTARGFRRYNNWTSDPFCLDRIFPGQIPPKLFPAFIEGFTFRQLFDAIWAGGGANA